MAFASTGFSSDVSKLIDSVYITSYIVMAEMGNRSIKSVDANLQ